MKKKIYATVLPEIPAGWGLLSKAAINMRSNIAQYRMNGGIVRKDGSCALAYVVGRYYVAPDARLVTIPQKRKMVKDMARASVGRSAGKHPPPDWLTTSQLAKKLGKARQWAWNVAKNGRVVTVQDDGSYLIASHYFDGYMYHHPMAVVIGRGEGCVPLAPVSPLGINF